MEPPGQSRVDNITMRCTTGLPIVLASATVATLLVTSSDVTRLPPNNGVSSALHRVTNAAAGIINRAAGIVNRFGCKAPRMGKVSVAGPTTAGEPIGTEGTLSHPFELPLVSVADMKDCDKWRAAASSKDPTGLENMLRLCRSHEKEYAHQIISALKTARGAKKWKNFTKTIEAVCIYHRVFADEISREINRAMKRGHDLYLAAILEGIAGKDQMAEIVGIVLAHLVIFGPWSYQKSVRKIHEHATYSGFRELSEVAMIRGREKRLAASIVCLQRRNDWSRGLIEEMAQITYENREYRTLGLLLEMRPGTKSSLRQETLYNLWMEISYFDSKDANELIRIFDISAAEVHRLLRYSVFQCIRWGSAKDLKNIINFLDGTLEVHRALRDAARKCLRERLKSVGHIECLNHILSFLDNAPQQYKLAVDEALEWYRQEHDQWGRWSRKRYQRFHDWATKMESYQEEDNDDDDDGSGQLHGLHLNTHRSIVKQLCDRICKCTIQ